MAAAALTLRDRAAALPTWLLTAAGLLVLLAGSLVLRTQAMITSLWIDEGLSIGIADRPLWDIPSVLRLDGAPPLYYMLLNLWMGAVGKGEGETHALSLLFALAFVPAAFFFAGALWGRREAWIAALVSAVLPYLTYYAQETRMYALVALLSLVIAASFALVFVHRRRGFLPVFALAQVVAMYTHNWALFLGAACGLTWLVLVWQADDERRPLLRDGVLAFGSVALLYAPWIPTLLFQAAHTGAPWSERPSFDKAVSGVTQMLGGSTAMTATVIGAGAGIAALTARRPGTLGGRSTAARAAIVVGALGLGTLALAWLTSQASPAWANRYFAVLVGPAVLVAAVGFARGGRLGLVTLLMALAFWIDPRVGELKRKSNAATVGALFSARVEPGDRVVVTHPEQSAVMSYYLPEGLRWADTLGPVGDPGVFDWRDVHERLLISYPSVIAEPLIRDLDPGQRLLLIQPLIRGQGWGTDYTGLVRQRVVAWERLLDGDPRLRRVDTAPKFGLRRPPRGLRGVLYVRR